MIIFITGILLLTFLNVYIIFKIFFSRSIFKYTVIHYLLTFMTHLYNFQIAYIIIFIYNK
jgi:hypothetical protein